MSTGTSTIYTRRELNAIIDRFFALTGRDCNAARLHAEIGAAGTCWASDAEMTLCNFGGVPAVADGTHDSS